MKNEQKGIWNLEKHHLFIVNLLLTLLVIVVYAIEESGFVKGLAITLYIASLWTLFALKKVRIIVEEEVTEEEWQ